MLWQVLGLLVVLITTRLLWMRWKYDLHRIPSPAGLPLLGHTLEFMYGSPSQNLAPWLRTSLQKLGFPKLMKIDLMGTSWLVVSDLSFIKDVMLSKTSTFPKYLADGGFILPMIGNDPSAKAFMMSELPTPYVKAVRRIFITALQSKNLKIAMPKLDVVMEKMISVIEAQRTQGPVDFQDLFVKTTLDIIGVVAFDTSLGGLDGSRQMHSLFLESGYIARDRFLNPLKTAFLKLFPNCKLAQRERTVIENATAEWDRLTTEVLGREDPPDGQEPIWHGLRKLIDPETGKPITRNSLRAELATVILGGMDTTGHQLGWLFAYLAKHPCVVKNILQELQQHGLYGPNARQVAFEDLSELVYLAAVIKEGMRIAYIVTASFLRFVPGDMTILGYRVPKNTLIICPGTRSVNTEQEWGDPDVFRPERWLTDEDMSQKYYIGFSFGPRDCVGQRLAMTEMRLVLIKLLTKYQLTYDGKVEEIFDNAKDGLVTEARDGIWLQVTPRTTLF